MKLPRWLRRRTPLDIAAQELDEAKRELLEMQTAFDYSKRMVDYHNDRVKRLTSYIQQEARPENDTIAGTIVSPCPDEK